MSTLPSGFDGRGWRFRPAGVAGAQRLHGASVFAPRPLADDEAVILRRFLTRNAWLLAVVLLGGCALLAPYDEVTDRAVTELAIRTEATLARADAGNLSAAESERFLADSIGTVRALRVRAGLKQQNSEEEGALGDLEERYIAFSTRRQPIGPAISTALRATLLDVQQIQLIKKRSAARGRARPRE